MLDQTTVRASREGSPRIERAETVRVGLWKGSVDPGAAVTQYSLIDRDLVANPVEPWVYLLGNDAIIRVHHVHTGALVATFTPGTGDYGALAISDDGRMLYVSDRDRRRTLGLDAVTGVMQREYLAPTDSGTPSHLPGPQMIVSRMNGHPVLYPPFIDSRDPVLPIDLETGQPLQGYDSSGGRYNIPYLLNSNRMQRTSANGEFHYRADNYYLEVRRVRFSTLRGPSFMFVQGPVSRRAVDIDDFCVAPDDTVLHSGPVAGINVALENLEPSPLAPLALPDRPFSLTCGWNGRVYATLSTSSGTSPNLAVFDGRTPLGTVRLGPAGNSVSGRPVISGDGTRLVWMDFSAGGKSLRIGAAP